MKILMFSFLVALSSLVHGQDWYEQWSNSGNSWAERWEKTMDTIDGFQPSQRIEILGSALGVASKGGVNDAERPVFLRAQAMLISIPGHAKYYQDKIEAMREEVLVNSRKSEEEIARMQDEGMKLADPWAYELFCVNAFRTLAQVPSPESVAVLGFYLNDPIGRDGKTLLGDNRSKPGDDFDPRPINAEGAAKAIRKLGIEHPPFQAPVGSGLDYLREGEVDAWKDWWNEVKDGKRTYRFIGSPIEYGPDGPASVEVVERAQLNIRRDEERAAGQRKTTSIAGPVSPTTQIPTSISLAGILAAFVLLAGAVWHFLRGRKAAPH